jgi:V/A-type H+-transporting ATPase subunit K
MLMNLAAKKWSFLSLSMIVVAPVLALAALLFFGAGLAAEPGESGILLDPEVTSWGLIAAAAATALSSLAAGYAVAAVGSAGVGALAEKPELMGRILVLVGLAEGIAIYGLIVSILIINLISP